jgi:hypothetical protein
VKPTPRRARSQREQLGTDELAVLAVIAERLRLGQRQYGALDAVHDRRDWTHEALEEALDLAVYLAAALLRTRR